MLDWTAAKTGHSGRDPEPGRSAHARRRASSLPGGEGWQFTAQPRAASPRRARWHAVIRIFGDGGEGEERRGEERASPRTTAALELVSPRGVDGAALQPGDGPSPEALILSGDFAQQRRWDTDLPPKEGHPTPRSARCGAYQETGQDPGPSYHVTLATVELRHTRQTKSKSNIIRGFLLRMHQASQYSSSQIKTQDRPEELSNSTSMPLRPGQLWGIIIKKKTQKCQNADDGHQAVPSSPLLISSDCQQNWPSSRVPRSRC